MSDRHTRRALHPSTRGVPAPAPDVGKSRSRIVIEPVPFPEAAAKPALRHAGLCVAGPLHGFPFLRHAPRACEGLRQELFPAFRLALPTPGGQGSALRSKDGGWDEILPLRSIESNRRTCASLMTEAMAFARL